MMNRPMEIDVWKGDWGLPSIDIECLQILTLAKFAGVPLQVNRTNNPLFTPKGKLPVFRHNKQVLSSFEAVCAYLKQRNYSPDFGLSTKQCSEITAYTKYLWDNLYPALQYVWWIDQRNYLGLTRTWYAKALPFPLNYYYPGHYESKAKDLIETLYRNIDDPDMIQTQVYSKAEKCLTAMSIRLGESEFLFGSHPSSLDATLYAYLAPLLKAPFPNNALQNHLKSCNNLHKFVSRISQRYFPVETQEYETKKKEESKESTKAEADFPNRRRNQIFAVCFAIIAMTGYAVSNGLVQMQIEDSSAADYSQYDTQGDEED